MSTAVIYCRLSRRTDKNAPNLKTQERNGRKRAKALGVEVVAVISEYGESAFEGNERPGYIELCDLVRNGSIDLVIAQDADRLWRDSIDQAVFVRDAQVGGLTGIALGADTTIDPNNPTDELLVTILGALARYESNLKRQRLLRKHRQLAADGKLSGGGTRPYGYAADRVTVIEDEAAVIKRIVAEVIDGRPLGTLCAELNRDDVPTVTGVPWRKPTLSGLVSSYRIAGWREHKGQATAPAVWPAIVSREDVEAVRAILADPSRKSNPGRPKKLLSGLARCTCHGNPLVSRPTSEGRQRYVVAQSPADGIRAHMGVGGDELDELVSAEVLAAVSGVSDDLGADTAAAARTAIARDRARLAELGARLALGEMSDEAFTAAEKVLLDRIAVNEQTASKVGTMPDLADLAARWDDLEVADRRRVIDVLVERVEIAPALRGRNTFDPDRVTVVWR